MSTSKTCIVQPEIAIVYVYVVEKSNARLDESGVSDMMIQQIPQQMYMNRTTAIRESEHQGGNDGDIASKGGRNDGYKKCLVPERLVCELENAPWLGAIHTHDEDRECLRLGRRMRPSLSRSTWPDVMTKVTPALYCSPLNTIEHRLTTFAQKSSSILRDGHVRVIGKTLVSSSFWLGLRKLSVTTLRFVVYVQVC